MSFSLPSNQVLSGYLDGEPVSVAIDLSQPCSRVRELQNEASRPVRFRRVDLPSLSAEFSSRKLVFLPCADVMTDVVLGRDWYHGCMALVRSRVNVGSSGPRSYLNRLMPYLNDSLLSECGREYVVSELRRHGFHRLPAEFSCHYLTLLFNHLFMGGCSINEHVCYDGCIDLLSEAGTPAKSGVVRYLFESLRTIMLEDDLPLGVIRCIFASLGISSFGGDDRSQVIHVTTEFGDLLVEDIETPFVVLESSIESYGVRELKRASFSHGIKFWESSSDELKDGLYSHLATGGCQTPQEWSYAPACETVKREVGLCSGAADMSDIDRAQTMIDMKIFILRRCASSFKTSALRRLARIVGLLGTGQNPHARRLKSMLNDYICTLCKGKFKRGDIPKPVSALRGSLIGNEGSSGPSHSPTAWPRKVPQTLKDKILRMFKKETSSQALKEFTCAVCGEMCRKIDNYARGFLEDIDLDLLRFDASSFSSAAMVDWAGFPRADLVQNLALEPKGVEMAGQSVRLNMCLHCKKELSKGRTPKLSLANRMLLGSVPSELRDLTPIEEVLIARCRAKGWIVQLKESDVVLPNAQRALRGNIIVFPQSPDSLSEVLPPLVQDVEAMVCVIFVGSSRPSTDWILSKAKPLLVRREKVRSALQWLKANNPLYRNVRVSNSNISLLPSDSSLQVPVRFQESSDSDAATVEGYDSTRTAVNLRSRNEFDESAEPIFDKVVVADVDSNASSNELRAAALRHITRPGGTFVEVPHDPSPINEFFNPNLFPMIYPTLYPFGIGGFEDSHRLRQVSLERHVKHLLSLSDSRFKEHPSFMFTVFNIIQRRRFLLHTKIRVETRSFRSISRELASLSFDAIHAVTERVARGDSVTAVSEEEKRVLKLMKQVKLVTSRVPGSSSARVALRNEIRALAISKGIPSFFVTINPADVYNPLVKFLAGSEIDVDALLPEQVPDSWEQSTLIARNPVVAAKFFNLYMKAFIKEVLGWESSDPDVSSQGGILGKVKAYYGCVEAQGRGSLHCHMLIWIEGALNPNEIRDKVTENPDGEFVKRLLEMLDDTISNAIPALAVPESGSVAPGSVASARHHPCAVRSLNPDDPKYPSLRIADLHHLVLSCQVHRHAGTCYKYWKGPPAPKECRFDLDEGNVNPISTVDPNTGEIRLRCLNGLVNNFNETILETMRCNMDIKFIGSGQSAKAIMYYVTDYITKTQLKAHVAYAALELAVKRLGESAPDDDDHSLRAKRLLQKCAYSLLSQQEISGQQVASYLLGYEDHFTSHAYRNLWWTSFERAVDILDPRYRLDNYVGASRNHVGNGSEATSQELGDAMEIEDDVTIYRDAGEIVARAGQTADYLWRGPTLGDVCLWDFVGQVDKVKHSTQSPVRLGSEQNNEENEPDVETNPATGNDEDHQTDDIFPPMNGNLQADEVVDASYVELLPDHFESKTHVLRVLPSARKSIPVPIGPGLPRRDRPETYERYCRVMLILFRPWRRPTDLKEPTESWGQAYESFLKTCPPRFAFVMGNMQMLHECKDSRDDHFARRHSGTRIGRQLVSSAWTEDVDPTTEDLFGGEIEEDILDHLVDIDRSLSLQRTRTDYDAQKCVAAAENAGIFANLSNPFSAEQSCMINSNEEQEVLRDDVNDSIEETWKRWYADQRRTLKRLQLLEATDSAPCLENARVGSEQPISRVRELQAPIGPSVREVDREVPSATITATDDMREIARRDCLKEFGLNINQARAFNLIVEAARQGRNEDPLRMYVGGCGGTGKSRVIEAVSAYFEMLGESTRYRLASYTGVAARNISGTTLHAVLSLHCRSKRGLGNKTKGELIAMWEKVDFLLIDEVSMIGCDTLLSIHEALAEAKSNRDALFGGINVIFFGDFAQLPPVGDARLLSKLNTRLPSQGGTFRGQRQILGKLLWLQVTTVVLLTESMRQAGSTNLAFVDLLGRLRWGRCNADDFHLLRTRLAATVIQTDADGRFWSNATIIVSGNAAKDALNTQAAKAFARSCGRDLHWYVAEDRHLGQLVTDTKLKEKLAAFHSGQTGQRMLRLPLVIGMPVILSTNYDVSNGAVNGSTGVLKRIRYYLNNDGERVAKSCIIQCDQYKGDALPNLAKQELAVMQDTTKVVFTHPHSGKRVTINRTQLPIAPAFAVTAHKAQGLTLKKAIIDLANCQGPESPYVMLSRVRALEDVLILREFDHRKISCGVQDHIRKELARIELLDEETRSRFGPEGHSSGGVERLELRSKWKWSQDGAGCGALEDYQNRLDDRSLTRPEEEIEMRPKRRGGDEFEILDGDTRSRKRSKIEANLIKRMP